LRTLRDGDENAVSNFGHGGTTRRDPFVEVAAIDLPLLEALAKENTHFARIPETQNSGLLYFGPPKKFQISKDGMSEKWL